MIFEIWVHMISSRRACHETLLFFTKFANRCWSCGRATARVAAIEAMSSYGNVKGHDDKALFEAQLLRPNSFCRRSFSAQLWEVIHEIHLQSITIGFPIQMHTDALPYAAFVKGFQYICIGNSIVMDWNRISWITFQSCAENDLPQKLLKTGISPWNGVGPSDDTNFS